MDKYAGMNKVAVRVTKTEHTAKPKRRGGYFRTLLWQTAAAICLCAALFAGKTFGGIRAARVTEKVKEAVCFDAFAFVATRVMGD